MHSQNLFPWSSDNFFTYLGTHSYVRFWQLFPPCAQEGLSANKTWTFESGLFQGLTVTPWGFAARYLWVKASDWRDQASVIKCLKSNKRKFTAVTWCRSSLGNARKRSAGPRGTARPGFAPGISQEKGKGGFSQRSFKIRSSELQIGYGKKEVLLVPHPSLLAVQSCTIRTPAPAIPSWRRWRFSPPPPRWQNEGWDPAFTP